MSTIYLDPVAMDATAGAIGDHAREAEAAALGLESVGAAAVPAELASWLADELADIALTVRMATVLYLVAAVDTFRRAEAIRTNQSLVTAFGPTGATTPSFAETGFVLGSATPTTDPFTSPAPATGGFVLGQVVPTAQVPSSGWQTGLLLGASGPNTPLGGYTPVFGGSSSLGDIPGYASTNHLLLSTPGRSYLGNNVYRGSGMTGSFAYVLPDPGHEK